ncbi:shikimate kinase [Flavobacteriaceae bacterium S356]|uniref:Shikimate kinase n=1 Tax=Asprobacillus argus TaxID=3076534 RepID=A0ABU3LFD2_9FLAO|nr:shikimate kinase [Flavobacteriaceae bacterium S356]
MKVILLGYMTSGKTAVGKSLSKKLFLPFIDLDKYISEKEQLSISEIFKTKGEIYFRKIEHIYLKELLNSDEKFVLSLGGGTPCYAGNMDLIKNHPKTISIYLEATIPTLVERLQKGKVRRPLVSQLSDEKLVEFVAKHLFERRNYYQQATHKVQVNDKPISTVVTEVRILLH